MTGGPFGIEPLFRDRDEAGTELARALAPHHGPETLVLGIPRGGVVVAAEVARRLGAELDVIVARKLGAPWQEELAIGAVTADGERWLDPERVAGAGATPHYIEQVTAQERAEADRRERVFRGDRPLPAIEGRTVIVVDDGLATGATARAALRSVRGRHPARLVLAVPVGADDSCRAVEAEADEIVCPHRPAAFMAISLFYRAFPQVTDAEVAACLSAWPSSAGL